MNKHQHLDLLIKMFSKENGHTAVKAEEILVLLKYIKTLENEVKELKTELYELKWSL